MRPLPTVLAALAAVLIPAAACAAPPAQIEKEARDRVVAAATEGFTAEEANDPEVVPAWMKQTKPDMFRKVDVNGDSLPDWLVNYERAPNASYFCGTGGCQQALYVGEPGGGFRKVWAHGGGPLKLSGPKSARRLEVDFHGSVCGSYGADECLRAYRWDSDAGRYVETPNSKGLAMLVSGPLPSLDPDLTSAPAEVQADVALRRQACEAAGAAYPDEDAIAYDIPDINGDGKRDWVVGSPYDDCRWEGERAADAPPARVLFLASRPDGTFAKAYEIDSGWDMDLSTTPAQVLVVQGDDTCGMGGKPCPRQPLVWDAAKEMLRPAE